MTSPECKVVQCNYRLDTSVCRAGARAYLTYETDSASGRVRVVSRSRSGRWVDRWENLGFLCSFRLKTLVSADPVFVHNQIARNRWGQDAVDTLNAMSDKIANSNG